MTYLSKNSEKYLENNQDEFGNARLLYNRNLKSSELTCDLLFESANIFFFRISWSLLPALFISEWLNQIKEL